MARSEIETLLSLDEWAHHMGVDPWSFNQLHNQTGRSIPCEEVWYQYPWQKDFLSRDELARAIQDAERMLAEQLHFWPAPQYTVGEVVNYPQPKDLRLYGYASNARYEWKAVQMRWHRFISGGALNRSDGSDEAVSLVDDDGDGVLDHFTATYTTSVTDPDEIGVYFHVDDRFSEALSEAWRIRPVKVTISGGTATIKGHITLLVKPELTTPAQPEQLALEAANLVSQVEIYRVYTDTTATSATPYQGVAEWDVPLSDSSAPGFKVLPVQFGQRYNSQGMPYAFLGQSCTWPYDREPDRLNVNYLSGIPRVNGRMNPHYADIVAKLATALLPSVKCGCERSNRIIHHWHMLVNDGDNGRNFTLEEINFNPFGEPRLGALYAWKRIKSLQDVEVISL